MLTERFSQKNLLLFSSFLILMALSVMVTFFYLQHRMENPPPPARTSFTGTGTPILTEDETQTILIKARKLREKWKVWAEKHKELLMMMQKEQSVDSKTLQMVYDALPAKLSPEITGISNDDMAEPPFMFTWHPAEKNHRLPPELMNDPKELEAMRKAEELRKIRLTKNFKSHRDIAIAQSIHFGKVYYKLWASGRITEGGIEEYEDKNNPLPNMLKNPPVRKEIEPPYDFLQNH